MIGDKREFTAEVHKSKPGEVSHVRKEGTSDKMRRDTQQPYKRQSETKKNKKQNTKTKKHHETHLPAAPVDRLRRDDRIQDLELGVPDGLVAERPLPATPLEPLHDALAASVQPVLVHLPCFNCNFNFSFPFSFSFSFSFWMFFVVGVASDCRCQQRPGGQLTSWDR